MRKTDPSQAHLVPTGVIPGVYGDALNSVTLKVDNLGRVTSIASTPIAFPIPPVPFLGGDVQGPLGANMLNTISNADIQVMATTGAPLYNQNFTIQYGGNLICLLDCTNNAMELFFPSASSGKMVVWISRFDATPGSSCSLIPNGSDTFVGYSGNVNPGTFWIFVSDGVSKWYCIATGSN